LLFGFLYFAAKGLLGHALLAFAMAAVSGGLSWLVYPFFARGILDTDCLKKGKIPIK
jgi:hypothetical protein